MNDIKTGSEQGAIMLRNRYMLPFSSDVLEAIEYGMSYTPLWSEA
jgi:hypothetical protein